MSGKAESVGSSLRELEELLEGYSPMMDGLTETVLETVLQYGVVFAEVRAARGDLAQH